MYQVKVQIFRLKKKKTTIVCKEEKSRPGEIDGGESFVRS